MPTGYTHDVAEGKVADFKTFLLRCSRAFGATLLQREEPMDVVPKYRPLESYSLDRLKEEIEKLQTLRDLSSEQLKLEANKWYEDALQSHKEYLAKNAATLKNYRAMLRKVRAWNPPTVDHVGLKDFMISQLQDSIKHDIYKPSTPKKISAQKWLADRLDSTKKSIEYSVKRAHQDIDRTVDANKWIDALFETVKK